MKCFVILSAVVVVCIASASEPNPTIVALAQKCKGDVGASDDDVNELAKEKIPETPEGKCLLKCFSVDHELISENKLDQDKLVEKVNLISGFNKEKEESAKQVGAACADVTNEDDECESAYDIWKCIEKESEELGVELFQ